MTLRIRRHHVAAPAVILALVALSVAAQTPSETKPASKTRPDAAVLLEIGGEVAQPVSYTAAEFARLPRRTVRAKGHDGVESQFQGVPLIDILSKAGVPTEKSLRGPALALFVVVEATDGYRAVFALPELDPEFTDRVILLADRRDDKPLAGQAGPLQVIVPGEKKHARWVRQVIRLKVGRG